MSFETYRPRHLRIIQPALVGFTGNIGGHDFKDGVSVQQIGYNEAMRLGSCIRMDDADTEGYEMNPVAELQRRRDLPATDVSVHLVDTGKHLATETMPRYTRQQLEAIADKRGIAGVREIARAWDRTSTSIVGCIDAILKAQEAADKAASDAVKPPEAPPTPAE